MVDEENDKKCVVLFCETDGYATRHCRVNLTGASMYMYTYAGLTNMRVYLYPCVCVCAVSNLEAAQLHLCTNQVCNKHVLVQHPCSGVGSEKCKTNNTEAAYRRCP